MISRSTQNKKGDLAFIASLFIISAAALISSDAVDGLLSKICFSVFLIFFFLGAAAAENVPVSFVYHISGDDLVIVRTKGKKQKRVCVIAITDIKKLTGYEKGRLKAKKYDYRGALFARETLRVYFDDGYDRGVILLTCAEEFKTALSSLFELYSDSNET